MTMRRSSWALSIKKCRRAPVALRMEEWTRSSDTPTARRAGSSRSRTRSTKISYISRINVPGTDPFNLVRKRDSLLDQIDRGLDGRDRDLGRLAQHLPSKLGDGARHGRGKQHGLSVRRQLGDDLANVVDESHVQHPVGFIEYEKLDFAEAQRVAADKVEQSSRRRHKHCDPIEQRADLRPHRNAADDQRGAELQVTAIGFEAVEDPARELARWAEFQRATGFAAGRPTIGCQMMQNGQRKGRRLAGTGLGDADHIAARECERNGFKLDWSWRGMVLFSQGTENGLGEAEVMERGQYKYSLVREDGTRRVVYSRVAEHRPA
jgi:hypothetical protein